MLIGIQRDTRAEHSKLFVSGIAFTVTLALLITLCVAIYQKAFVQFTTVSVEADQAGLQLPRYGDVRMHGVIVGQIREIDQDGKKAVIQLGLEPDQAEQIPANVSVAIKPTTLFGQKYVEFIDPTGERDGVLSDGAVIPADRVRTSVELDAILARLFPLLKSIRPQDLNSTLHALATALSGNGEKLGETMVQLNDYLEKMNVHLPTLERDLNDMADVAETYSMAAPDLVKVLENTTTTAKTVTQQQERLGGLLTSVTGVADTSENLLAENEKAIRYESELAVPLLKLLSDYSPEYTCLLKGLDKFTDLLATVFQQNRVRQTMVLDGTQKPAYGREDRPEWGEIGHGPWCDGLPNPKVPADPLELENGSEDVPWGDGNGGLQ
ncbi:phospholipid/cholesterol/gamma-HCH transport system substrate-binding protein [Nocardioides albertanoniae]|uniref:Phospholipid/cholesterol/gamma-HCH transport system substrate-binding protein n=1 Tax=Nocardioides albertanoniae TaxID=1175486 RepID=A0A543A771_9ACTN|nr:MCE family protein [Nocardioides albertanoniae]TQL68437.1 phospholipid/cholesterol/gamma-HCH transport system substrate-binding protein [Nocardioides albertanoniae]